MKVGDTVIVEVDGVRRSGVVTHKLVDVEQGEQPWDNEHPYQRMAGGRCRERIMIELES